MHIETKSGVSFLTFDVFKNENLIAAVSTKNGGVSTGGIPFAQYGVFYG